MKEVNSNKMEITRRIEVNDERSTSHLGEGLGVYATPCLISDIEGLCHDVIADLLDEGESSVGTHVDIKHMSATPQGMWVDIKATVKEIDRRAVHFEIEAHDQFDQVASCKHSRFVVVLDQVKQRVSDKIMRSKEA